MIQKTGEELKGQSCRWDAEGNYRWEMARGTLMKCWGGGVTNCAYQSV